MPTLPGGHLAACFKGRMGPTGQPVCWLSGGWLRASSVNIESRPQSYHTVWHFFIFKILLGPSKSRSGLDLFQPLKTCCPPCEEAPIPFPIHFLMMLLIFSVTCVTTRLSISQSVFLITFCNRPPWLHWNVSSTRAEPVRFLLLAFPASPAPSICPAHGGAVVLSKGINAPHGLVNCNSYIDVKDCPFR